MERQAVWAGEEWRGAAGPAAGGGRSCAAQGCSPLLPGALLPAAAALDTVSHLLNQHVRRQQAAHGSDGELKHVHARVDVKAGMGAQPGHRLAQRLRLPHDLRARGLRQGTTLGDVL